MTRETSSRILIVDDNQELCVHLRNVLEGDGYTIETATNGIDAINLSQKNRCDVALVGFTLPDITGTELVNNLLNISPSIECICITAHATLDKAIKAAKQERVISSELKPLDMNRLLSLLNQVFKRREAEEEVQKLTHAVEQSPGSIIITDTKGNIEYANLTFEKITGYRVEEVLGEKMSIFKSDVTPLEVYRELWKTIKSGNEWRGEICNRKKNGEMYWESVTIKVVKDDAGIITKFLAVNEDITERKQSERRLIAQHEVTKVLAEANTIEEASSKIIQAVCIALEWDLGEIWEFDRQKEVLHNTEIWHVSSLEVPEFKAATKKISFPPQIGLPGRVWESVEPVWIADVIHETNFLRASVADKEGLHSAFGFPIIIGSEVLGTICFFSREIREPDRDLLDMMTAVGRQIGLFIKRKQAEEILLQSEKLNSLGTITAGVSHEFNNILTVISGNIQLLEGSYIDYKEFMDTIRTIERAINDGVAITRRMLKFTRTEKDATGFVHHDINDLLKQAIDFTMPRWKNMANAKGVNYHIGTEGIENVLSILCNPTEIREVFVNMIINALDAMPDGGRISFTTLSNIDTAIIRVSDNGEGMSEEVKKRIFDPFFTTKGEVGTGLGMSMVYGIISRHGGKIEVESKVGEGTTFTLHFPISNKAEATKGQLEPEHEIKSKGLRIMVVDDNEAICKLLDIFFSKDGHVVRTVVTGAEAIALAKVGDYDIVLSDVAMPEVCGYDVIKNLNKLEKRPKIGIMTGWGENLNSMSEEELNIDFIVKKPFDFSDLKRQINALFDKEI